MHAITLPAIRGDAGSKFASFQMKLSPSEVEEVLGHDPRSTKWKHLPETIRDRYEAIQRKTVPSRRESMRTYMVERMCSNARMPGALPPIVLGMCSRPEFISTDQHNPELGLLRIPLGLKSDRLLLDGLGRVTAALELIEGSHPEIDAAFDFSVLILAPKDSSTSISIEEFGQLFHDMNFLGTKLNVAHSISLDGIDPYTAMARQIGQHPVIAEKGGLAVRGSSAKPKGHLVSLQSLVRFVRGAVEGSQGEGSIKGTPKSPKLTSDNFDEFREKLESFLDAFAEAMGDERFKDPDFLHLRSAGWQVLGRIFHALEFKFGESGGAEAETVITKAAELDWSLTNPYWIGYLGEADTGGEAGSDSLPRVKINLAGREMLEKLSSYVFEHSGLDALLNKEEEPVASVAAA